jgi:acyl-[acyl-carrier-protein]-phospholipid O-acyltransferase/long-chain-fatty-acid--[acyl-carrier-protein] ligase
MNDGRTLASATLQMARRHPGATAVSDVSGSMNRIKLAGAALALRRALGLAAEENNVGVLLPPGKGGTIVNLTLAIAGRTAVNLNHTAGDSGLKRMCELADVHTIITAGKYTEKIGKPEVDVRWVDVLELIPKISKFSVILNMLKVLFTPAATLVEAKPDDVACLVFSSGSTGDPKGVQLTHRQILANVDGLQSHFDLKENTDGLLSPLPLFHSFGVSAGMWMPLVCGLGLTSHSDPFDGRAIGKLAEQYKPTVLIGTPTFVRGYMRRASKEQFASLRLVVVGAEKCPDDLRASFVEKYDTELLEAYGCTELAPAISANRPDYNRPGSVGQPIPGVEVITIDPDTSEILPQGETGLLLVRSPARMLGYLGREDLTSEVFLHGGYNTGDIGYVDDDGFVFITGRLARFAKIGGEMVPMDLVDEKLMEALQDIVGADHDHELAVAKVSDKTRGERLVLLYTSLPCAPRELVDRVTDLPALFKPKERNAYEVDELPVLGTGKRDLKKLAQLAEQMVIPQERV